MMPVKLSKALLDLMRRIGTGVLPTSISPLRCATLVELGLAKRAQRTWGDVVIPNSFEVALTKSGHQRLAAERKTYIFVGECRSLTAIRKGWSWQDGHLAAKPLFEALEAMGIEPAAQHFINLYTDPPANHRGRYVPKIDDGAVTRLRISPWIKVALGRRVSDELTKLGIDHVALVHPAARGKIRKRARYVAHVKERLT